MSRLVSFELTVGRVVSIDGTRYRIADAPTASPKIIIERQSDAFRTTIFRAQLAANITRETAFFEDELGEDDEDEDEIRNATNISFLESHRIIDWSCRLFLLRKLIPLSGESPKSTNFPMAHAKALAQLEDYLERSQFPKSKSWTCWTMYKVLLAWRKSDYSIGSILTKGVRYAPWGSRAANYSEIEEAVKEIVAENPNFTHAQIMRKLGWKY